MIEIGGGIALALILVLLWYEFNVLPYIFLAGLLYMLYRLTSGKLPQLNSLGFKSRPVSKVLFDQIGGQEMAKKELLEALEFIKNPQKIRKMGIRPLKGILLIGPPGTGKTPVSYTHLDVYKRQPEQASRLYEEFKQNLS